MRIHRTSTYLGMGALALAVFSFLVACSISGDTGVGTVLIRTSTLNAARNTYEPGNTEITHYRVYGSGPNGLELEETVPSTQTQIVLIRLAVGWWRFDVDALNSDGAPVITGMVEVLVQDDVITEVDVTLSPVQGSGTLTVEFRWPAGAVDDPGVAASLSVYNGGEFGTPEPLVPFEEGSSGDFTTYTYTGAQDAGYYALSTTVTDGSAPRWENMDTVRILNGFETVVGIDLETGDVSITIILDPQDPLEVSLEVTGDLPIGPGQDIVANASVTGGSGSYEYRWYLDGTLLPGETTSEVTIGSALDPGRYRLSLVASDGTVLGSDWIVFDVVP